MQSFQQFAKTSQIQKLQMTYLMKRAFLMLQMTNLELKNFLEMEIEKNPILEIKPNYNYNSNQPNDEKKTFSSIKYKPSLFEHLFTQAKEAFFLKKDLFIAENIIGNLDKRGYFSIDLEIFAKDLNISQENIFKVLKIIQTFDPKGIAAKNLKERFLIQIDNKKSLEYKIINDHFENILKNKISIIAKKIKKNVRDTQNIIEKIILRSNFDPTEKFSYDFPKDIRADISINKLGKNWVIEIDDDLPYFEINKNLVNLLEKDKKYSSKKYLFLAMILMKNIKMRRKTLYNISLYIIKKQRSYLLDQSDILPMSIKEVAASLNLHPSTISRSILNKYIKCPKGLLPIKSFFTQSLKSEKNPIDPSKAKLLLIDLISNENKQKPLSDAKITQLMSEKGFSLHRRTIAKYRKILKIGSSSQRKRYL
ncbi:MAG: RNA polymerase sigma-54 factor [Candidatus Anoxychlamydiales bacterium]|nr:RNA polymerase sigma-54 factor [Candidatus Anoxychlamydiales bacterium]